MLCVLGTHHSPKQSSPSGKRVITIINNNNLNGHQSVMPRGYIKYGSSSNIHSYIETLCNKKFVCDLPGTWSETLWG